MLDILYEIILFLWQFFAFCLYDTLPSLLNTIQIVLDWFFGWPKSLSSYSIDVSYRRPATPPFPEIPPFPDIPRFDPFRWPDLRWTDADPVKGVHPVDLGCLVTIGLVIVFCCFLSDDTEVLFKESLLSVLDGYLAEDLVVSREWLVEAFRQGPINDLAYMFIEVLEEGKPVVKPSEHYYILVNVWNQQLLQGLTPEQGVALAKTVIYMCLYN